MKKNNKAIASRQRSIAERLDRRWQPDRTVPVMQQSNIAYEVSSRIQGMAAGGMGIIEALVDKLGLREAIDRSLRIFKRRRPYFESDHILALVYNILCGGKCLEDLELFRRDEASLNSVGARRIPDPTTAGDFLRRFDEKRVELLQDTIQLIRAAVWREQPESARKLATIDVDGTITETDARCKEGTDISYNGKWGYAPLVLSLANSHEILRVLNRPANRPSHEGAAAQLDSAAMWALGPAGFEKVRFRGDTDFSQTTYLDGWSEKNYEFIFGMDARPGLIKRAQAIPATDWKILDRRKEPRAKSRKKAPKVKDAVIQQRGFKVLTLVRESYAELSYRPAKSKRHYRLIVVRKEIEVHSGQLRLENETRYFFYISNIEGMAADDLVRENNQRCDQENLIQQFKNGVHGGRNPVREFHGNWAYMVICSLAWNLKAWLGLLLPKALGAPQLLRMEFRKFLHEIMLHPVQILRTGRRLIFRLLAVNPWTRLLIDGTRALQRCFT